MSEMEQLNDKEIEEAAGSRDKELEDIIKQVEDIHSGKVSTSGGLSEEEKRRVRAFAQSVSFQEAVNKKDYDSAMDHLELYWEFFKDIASSVLALAQFLSLNNDCHLVQTNGQVKIIGRLGKQIESMEKQADRLSGSPVGFLGNLFFILLAAAALWFLWIDPRFSAWSSTFIVGIGIVLVFLLIILIWVKTGDFEWAAWAFGACVIFSLWAVTTFSEDQVIAGMILISKFLISLFVAVLFVPRGFKSFLKNLYAMTHIWKRASARDAFYREQADAKHHIEAMLSRMDEFDKLVKEEDEFMLTVLREMIKKEPQPDNAKLLGYIKSGSAFAKAYYKYADSAIVKIAKLVR